MLAFFLRGWKPLPQCKQKSIWPTWIPGYVDGGINLIDMGDCALGIISAMENGEPGEKYILGNRNVTIKEYFDLIVDVAGRGRSPFLKLPKK